MTEHDTEIVDYVRTLRNDWLFAEHERETYQKELDSMLESGTYEKESLVMVANMVNTLKREIAIYDRVCKALLGIVMDMKL